MHKWFVHDSDGREIYLTEERGEHIASGHSELRDHLEDVPNTVRRGKRRQQPQDRKLMSIVYAVKHCDRPLMASWLLSPSVSIRATRGM